MNSLRMVWLCAFASVLVARAEEVPGIVNFVEGKVSLDGQAVANDSIGTAVMRQGQALQTGQGRAEVLLTPGVFVRVGENSELKMDAVSANEVKVELVRGFAVVEVDCLEKSPRLDVIDNGADAHLDHSGVYLFQTEHPAIAVYFGKLRVEDDRRGVAVGQGEELRLGEAGSRPRKFDRGETNSLYTWSVERASYASDVSEWTGESLLGLDRQAKYTDGWYWNPWYKSWAYLPEKGFVRTPFGYGIYAPQAPHYLGPVFADFRS